MIGNKHKVLTVTFKMHNNLDVVKLATNINQQTAELSVSNVVIVKDLTILQSLDYIVVCYLLTRKKNRRAVE